MQFHQLSRVCFMIFQAENQRGYTKSSQTRFSMSSAIHTHVQFNRKSAPFCEYILHDFVTEYKQKGHFLRNLSDHFVCVYDAQF